MAESRKIIWQTVESSAVGLRRLLDLYNEKKLSMDHQDAKS